MSLWIFQGWNSERQSGISPVNLEQNTGFLSGPLFIRTKKEQHMQNSGSMSTSQYCSPFLTEFYCARCSESCFSGLESKLAFFMDAEVTFFQYAKTIPQSNVTFYCNFRLRFRSSWEILRLSITTLKGSYHGSSERAWCSKFAKVWEKIVWTSARSSTNFRAPSDSLFS